MIPARELRIGNIVNTNDGSIVIENILEDAVNGNPRTDYVGSGYDFDQIEPIPLTPEILEQCGFERGLGNRSIGSLMGIGDWIEIAEFYFCDNFYSFLTQSSTDRNKFYLSFHYSCHESNEEENLCSIKYLHQLQNLYFALTSEELVVNW